MASNYSNFFVTYTLIPGQIVPMAGATVKVFACDDDPEDIFSGIASGEDGADVATLTADGNGEIAAGTVSSDVGTLLRFRVENYPGGIAWTKQEIST